MMKVCALTTTRADFSLLLPVIKKFESDKDITFKVIVTGSHLSKAYGETYKEIEHEGLKIDKKIPILSDETDNNMNEVLARTIVGFGEYFACEDFNAAIVLGDRYETLGAAEAALLCGIPICHIHGGEITLGAIDDYIRNAITKLSYLHFTSCEEYRQRVIQMGESPKRVFNVGSLGLENIKTLNLLSKKQLESELEISLDKPVLLITYHPETMSDISPGMQIDILLSALEHFKDCELIFTKANADEGGMVINEHIDDFKLKHAGNTHVYSSLGGMKYLSLMKLSSAVVGNTSSGIIETPGFHMPSVNIGNRQKGRTQAGSVLNSRLEKDDIIEAINTALSKDFRNKCENIRSPYEGNNTSEQIYKQIKAFLPNMQKCMTKEFYDISFEEQK